MLAIGSRPDPSWLGAIVSTGAVIFMSLLSRLKSRVAVELGSAGPLATRRNRGRARSRRLA